MVISAENFLLSRSLTLKKGVFFSFPRLFHELVGYFPNFLGHFQNSMGRKTNCVGRKRNRVGGNRGNTGQNRVDFPFCCCKNPFLRKRSGFIAEIAL